MFKYLHHASLLQCVHGGQIQFIPPIRSFYIEGSPILTESDLLSAVIIGCPQVGPGIKPCTKVTQIILGKSREIQVDGEVPLLENLQAMTDGNPPGMCLVVANQTSNAEIGFVFLGSDQARTLVAAHNSAIPFCNVCQKLTSPDKKQIINKKGTDNKAKTDSPPNSDIQPDLWLVAMNSLRKHKAHKSLKNSHIITLVDFRIKSASKRLWVIDLNNDKVLFHEYVTHGRNSGSSGNSAVEKVGNEKSSFLSSVGAFVTYKTTRVSVAGQKKRTDSRTGKIIKIPKDQWIKKPALDLVGLDETNNMADKRNIIFHGAWYIDQYHIEKKRIGRSQGCFATEQSVNNRLIEKIKGGTFVYAFNG